MKTKQTTLLVGIASISTILAVNTQAAGTRLTENFDAGWKFLKASANGAEKNNFNDLGWRKLDLPHDWSIEGPFATKNPTGGAGAWLPGGIGWYRKHFTLPENVSGKMVRIEFDGVMQNSDVWINGFHLGHRPYGYVSFSYELTGHLNPGGDNVLAVRADTSAQPASRWYSGAGIYRHVRLVLTNPVHIARNGVFISTPKISPDEATVRIEISVANESSASHEITAQTSLMAPDGKTLGTIESSQTVGKGAVAKLGQQIVLPHPQLWNLDDPKLFRAVSEVREGGKILDELTTAFGIRNPEFIADTGFWLNGKNFKIKGVCLHIDGSAFGSAVPLAIWEARLKALKLLGVNAIRTAHNPPAPEFLDLCDRMGFLVMDELFDCWTVAKNPFDYHLYFDEWSKTDLRDTILRDRNHPSVILYSVGNEIHDTPQEEKAKRILQGLVDVAHATDPTRPVTQALFRPNRSHDYDNGLADLLDVVGQNYREKEILAAHEQKPSRKIIGTENGLARSAWTPLRDHAFYAGQFLWTGIDYLGESRRWPGIASGSGLLDRTIAPKPAGFERQSWWSDQPMVSIVRRTGRTYETVVDPGYEEPVPVPGTKRGQVTFPDWSPADRKKHNEQVEAYSNCEEVELFLNGKTLGSLPLPADASARQWTVPFEPGTLKAVARNEGKMVATDELQTAGKPVGIILSTETRKLSSGWDEVAMVRARIVDGKGIKVPDASDLISFKISGPGVIAVVDSADNKSHEPFQAVTRHAYQGECVAFVKAAGAGGKIILTAGAVGLNSGTVQIEANSLD